MLRFLLDGFKKPFPAKAELTITPIRIDNTIKKMKLVILKLILQQMN